MYKFSSELTVVLAAENTRLYFDISTPPDGVDEPHPIVSTIEVNRILSHFSSEEIAQVWLRADLGDNKHQFRNGIICRRRNFSRSWYIKVPFDLDDNARTTLINGALNTDSEIYKQNKIDERHEKTAKEPLSLEHQVKSYIDKCGPIEQMPKGKRWHLAKLIGKLRIEQGFAKLRPDVYRHKETGEIKRGLSDF